MMKMNLGKELEKLMTMKETAEKNAASTEEEYSKVAFKEAQSLKTKLDKILKENKEIEKSDIALVADAIFKAITEIDMEKLVKLKDAYDYWKDIDDRFNS